MGRYRDGQIQLRQHTREQALRCFVYWRDVESHQAREHREGAVEGFTKQYGIKQLVWFEIHIEIVEAITREKQIKKWSRNWKVNLIQGSNPDWRDLYDEIAI
jgi:putative endonuclease